MTSAINTTGAQTKDSSDVAQNKLLTLVLLPIYLLIWLFGFALTGCVILVGFYVLYWFFSSYQHAYDTLINIYNYNAAHFYVNPHSLIGGWIEAFYQTITHALSEANHYVVSSAQWVQENTYLNQNVLSDLPVNDHTAGVINGTMDIFYKFWSLIQVAFYVTVIKLLTSLSFYQLYLIALILACITGNHKRLYRRYCIDRESEAKHRIIRGMIVWLPSMGVILYLVMPFTVNPMLVAATSSFVFYILLHYLIGSFKKYL